MDVFSISHFNILCYLYIHLWLNIYFHKHWPKSYSKPLNMVLLKTNLNCIFPHVGVSVELVSVVIQPPPSSDSIQIML